MPNPYLPSLEDYGDSAAPLDKLTHRNRRAHIKPLETGRGHWAPHTGPRTCVDRTGRVRSEHSYSVERRRGLECLFCGKKWGGRLDKERER